MRNRSTYGSSTRARKRLLEEEARELRKEERIANLRLQLKAILGKLKANLPENERAELMRESARIELEISQI